MTQITLPDGSVQSFETKADARQFLSSYADNLEADSTLRKDSLLVGNHLITIEEV